MPTYLQNLCVAFLIFCIAYFVTGLLIRTKSVHEKYTGDVKLEKRKNHVGSIPRIGGIGIFISLGFASAISKNSIQEILVPILFASIPVVLVGFAEDISKKVSVKLRLFVTFLSAIFYVALTKNIVQDIDFPPTRLLFENTIFSFVVTCLAISGMVHAFNIIDGSNGLAGGSAMIIFATIAVFCYHTDDSPLFWLSLFHVMAITGFLAFNFPKGLIFLGDGGAYYIGFVISIAIILLTLRNPEISPWTAIIIIAHPLIETIYSVLRRLFTKNTHPFRADDLHLHLLVYRFIQTKRGYRVKRAYANSAAGGALCIFSLIASALAIFARESVLQSQLSFLALVILYIILYRLFSKNASEDLS